MTLRPIGLLFMMRAPGGSGSAPLMSSNNSCLTSACGRFAQLAALVADTRPASRKPH